MNAMEKDIEKVTKNKNVNRKMIKCSIKLQ